MCWWYDEKEKRNLYFGVERLAVVQQRNVVIRMDGIIIVFVWMFLLLLDQNELSAFARNPLARALHFSLVQFQDQSCRVQSTAAFSLWAKQLFGGHFEFPLLKYLRTHYWRHYEPFSVQKFTRLQDFAFSIESQNFFLGTCEASWFDSISNRSSDSRFDS